MDASGHFGFPKIMFGRISRHFRSIFNFYNLYHNLDDRKSRCIAFLTISDTHTRTHARAHGSFVVLAYRLGSSQYVTNHIILIFTYMCYSHKSQSGSFIFNWSWHDFGKQTHLKIKSWHSVGNCNCSCSAECKLGGLPKRYFLHEVIVLIFNAFVF